MIILLHILVFFFLSIKYFVIPGFIEDIIIHLISFIYFTDGSFMVISFQFSENGVDLWTGLEHTSESVRVSEV